MNKIKVDTVLDELKDIVYEVDNGIKLIINISDSTNNNYEFNLNDNAELIINKFIENRSISDTFTINLNGINSRVIYNFSVLCSSDEKFIINVNHNNKNTISNITNHGVVLNDSRLEFIINSKVEKGNINSVLNQSSKIITMGKNNSEIKPNLFIDEFNVDARHAASIGTFNKKDIFYLCMKGIREKDAKKLLIDGFLKGHLK